MKYTITGYLKEKKPILTLGSKGFQKGEIWVEPDGTQYPQTLCFSLMRGSLTVADKVDIGAHVSIDFEIAGRVWQDRCYNELIVLDLAVINDEANDEVPNEEVDIDKLYDEITNQQPSEEAPF